MGLGKEGLQPRHLRVGQPEKIAHDTARFGTVNHVAKQKSMGPDPSFQMLVFGSVCSQEGEPAAFSEIQVTLCDLFEYLGIEKNEFFLTYPRNATFLGTNLSQPVEKLDKLSNYPLRATLVPIDNETAFSNTTLDRSGTGAKFELFLRRSRKEIFEIGTLICDNYLIDRSRSKLVASNNSFVVCAIGLERLHAVLGGSFDVLKSGETSGVIFSHFRETICPKKRLIFDADVREMVDSISTIVSVARNLRQPLDKNRLKVLRKVVNGFRRSYLALGINQYAYDFWVDTVVAVFDKINPGND